MTPATAHDAFEAQVLAQMQAQTHAMLRHALANGLELPPRLLSDLRGAEAAAQLPPYDDAVLRREMRLMPEWFCTRHLGLELDVFPQIEFVGDPVEVFDVLAPFAERVGIGEVDAEQVRVGPAGRIDAGAGIAVFPPGAADAGVLLDDGEGEAGLAQLQGGVQPAHASADHRHGERAGVARVRAVHGAALRQ